MKNGLDKKTKLNGNPYEKYSIDVWDTFKKEKIFTGGYIEVANFLSVPNSYPSIYLRTRGKIKRRYALRISK